MEQATTLPYMTLRFAQEGARVIRVESPPYGDPNRWVGPQVMPGEEGMNAYFLPNNLGKESITLNLREPQQVEMLQRLISELGVDIFATNQRPRSYRKLRIDYETLSEIKTDLIWLGVTGFGPQSDEAAYDPILQARAGFMDLTGEAEGEPMVFGLPMVDLGAGEHAYGQVMKALYRRAVTGEGARLDISMFQSAVSWMVSPIMLSKSFDVRVSRQGNTHQFFAPVSVFPTRDGFVYLAVGNDRQWEQVTKIAGFENLARKEYEKNAGRIHDLENLNRDFAARTRRIDTESLIGALQESGVPVSRVNTLLHVCADPLIAPNMVSARDPKTGTEISIPPPPIISSHLLENEMSMGFPPRLGEHNASVFQDIGIDWIG
jgi:formyl-CoA transferase